MGRRSRAIRVFVSSTFRDFERERNLLSGMEMRVLNAALFFRRVYREVGNHSLSDELLPDELTRKGDVFLHRQFVL